MSDEREYWRVVTELRKAISQPLPGGLGSQIALDQQIKRLAAKLGEMEPPDRFR